MAFLFVATSACTVYKSEGRKQFESEGARKLTTRSVAATSTDNEEKSFKLIQCKKENALETWLNEEFPRAAYELVLMDNDLEIWRTTHDGFVEIRALQKMPQATHSCVYQFANESTWTAFKSQFIKELQNNMMTLE